MNRISGTLLSSPVRAFDKFSIDNVVDMIPVDDINSAEVDTWVFGSAFKTIINGGIRINLFASASATFECYLDTVIAIDLTASFGAGNEPTQSEFDVYIQAKGFFLTASY
jgi:hypothetical protein